MPTSLETLKTRKETIRDDLDQLKSLSQSQEKEQKQEKIATEISELDQELQAYLAQESDAAKKAEAQEVVKELATFSSALESLKQEVLEDQKSVSESKDEQSLATPKEDSVPEEKKNFLQKGIDWIKGDGNESHHTAKAVGRGALVASGVGIAVYGLGKLFGRWGKKEEKSSDENSSEKPKKTSRWKKALAWTGGILGGTWLGRGLITGKRDLFGRNPFSKEKKDGPETAPSFGLEKSAKAYEKLTEDEKKPFEASASAINEYQGNVMGNPNGAEHVEDLLGDSAFDQNKEGFVPYILNNRYANLEKMLGETAFYYEILGLEGHVLWDKMKDWTLDQLKTFVLVPLAGVVDIATFNLLSAASTTGEFIDKLKTIPDAEQTMRTVFRKSISVMSYYQSRKRALEYQLAEQELLKSDPTFTELSEEKKSEKIADQLDDEAWYQQYIKPEVEAFMGKSLKDATVYLQERNLFHGEVDPLVRKSVDKVEERKKDLLEIDDEDDISNLSAMKSEIQNGRLPEKVQKKLEKICEDFEDEMEDTGRQSWYMKYLPMFQILGADEQTLHQIQKTGDYDRIIGVYKQQMQEVLKKSKDGTLTESDLTTLENTIEDYYAFQKSLVSLQVNMSKAIDENGNILVRWLHSVKVGGQNIFSGFQMVFDGKKGNNIKGGALVAGGILSIDALTFGVAEKKVLGFSPFRALNKKVLYPVAKGGLKLTGDAVVRLTGNTMRARLPGLVPAHFYYTQDTFRIAVGRGEISLERAAKIAKIKGFSFGQLASGNGTLVETPEHVIQYLFGSNPQEAKRVAALVDQFGDNPKIYQQIFTEDYTKVAKRWRKPQEWLKMNRANVKFQLNVNALEKLEQIAKRVNSLPDGTQKKVLQSMMRSIKSIDNAENFAIMGVGDDMVKFLESGKMLSAEKYGKYLAKYAGKIDANDLRAFEKFVMDSETAGKIGKNQNLFVRNALKNFAKLKSEGFAVDKIDDLGLNASRWSRLAEVTKANTNKMVASLEKMKGNVRFKPFWNTIGKQVDALKDYAKTITPEGMKAMQNFSVFGKETAFTKLSAEGMHELSRLSSMLRDAGLAKDLTQALKGAKTVDEVKAVLSGKGIAVNHIDDVVLLKLSKTKSTKGIRDIVHYGAEFKSIQGVQKLIQNPAMKYAGRLLGKALIVGDALLVGYNFTSQLGEAQEIKTWNLERGDWKENQAYYELGTGGLGAVAGACMFIPGAGWVAGGVLLASMGALEVGKTYFEDINKFKQNQSDFLAKGIAATKQELTSVDSWDQGLSRSWIDAINLGGSTTKKQIGTPKTKAEALNALIKMEELQKNPLAGADLNDSEVLKDSNLVEAVRSAKQQVEEIVQKRFEYFKKQYLDQKKPLIDKSKFGSNQALEALENALEFSVISVAMESDSDYAGGERPEQYQKYQLEQLKSQNAENFEKLEKLFSTHQTSLFECYAQLPYYRDMLMNYGDEQRDELLAACDFFAKYMQYKMLGKSLDKRPKVEVDPEKIDYTPIHEFLSHFDRVARVVDAQELGEKVGLISDGELLEKYGVSGILGQDILFEWAKVLSYTGKNNLEALKHFFHESKKEVNGIYFDGKNWVVNENNGSDDEFAKDSELSSLSAIEKMREYVYANTHGNLLHGKMFTESTEVNKELGTKLLNIIDEYKKLRMTSANVKNEIVSYVKNHYVEGKYVALPLDIVLKARKAGLANIGAFVYGIKNGKLTAYRSAKKLFIG